MYLCVGGSDSCCTLARKHRPTNLRDLFVAPSFDELDAVAVDSSGEPRRLTGKQLESLRERGWVDARARESSVARHAALAVVNLDPVSDTSINNMNYAVTILNQLILYVYLWTLRCNQILSYIREFRKLNIPVLASVEFKNIEQYSSDLYIFLIHVSH